MTYRGRALADRYALAARIDQRLDCRATLDGTHGRTYIFQSVSSGDHFSPRLVSSEARCDLDCAMEVLVLGSPASAQLHVLSVDLKMRIDLYAAVIGVVSAHDDTSTVSNQIE